MKILNSILGVMFLSYPLIGKNLQVQNIDIRYQISPDDGDISPVTRYPFYWNKNSSIYSGIEYSSSSTTGVILDSDLYEKKSISMEKKEVTFTIFGYSKKYDNWAVSSDISANYLTINKNEFGYAIEKYKNLSETGDLFFDNKIDIDVLRARIGLTILKRTENFGIGFSGMVYPYSNLNVDQELLLRPISKNIGRNKSSNDLKPSYEARLNISYKLTKDWSIMLLGEYYILPIEYDMLSLDSNQRFITQNITNEEERYIYMAKILTPLKKDGIRLSFGYGQQKTRVDGVDSGIENIISIGFDSEF